MNGAGFGFAALVLLCAVPFHASAESLGKLLAQCTNADDWFPQETQTTACTTLSRSEQTDPEIRGSAYSILGGIYTTRREFDRAVDEFTGAIKVQPKEGEYFGNRAMALFFLGRRDEALLILMRL
jgi:Flp pilus assembly protein TadD